METKIQLIIDGLKRSGLDQSEIDHVLSLVEFLDLKKGQNYLESGKICDKLAVIYDGILCSYKINDQGDKEISQFFLQPFNHVVIDFPSYTQNSASEITIKAIEDSKLLIFDRSTIEQINKTCPKLVHAQRELAKRLYLNSLHLIHVFQTCNASEKIKLLQSRAPELFAKVPYSYLASYLGIHRNTFNAAMKKL